MFKRTIIRIGDIFCAEIDGKFKCYFQYVCIDETMMYTQVARVFRTHYALSDSPTVEEIINDEVLFYAHVPIRVGIELKAWYKLGKCKILPGKEELDKVLFAYCSASFSDGESIDFEDQDPIDNWLVWKINKPMRHLHLNQLTQAYKDAIFEGALEAYCDVIHRMKYGYYRYNNPMYDVIKRIPLPDVDRYCRREVDGMTIYYHFHGANLVREVFVDGDTVYSLSDQEPISPRYSLDSIKFWDINWSCNDFITEEEFNHAWSGK